MTPSSNASSHLEKPEPHGSFSTCNPSGGKEEAAGQTMPTQFSLVWGHDHLKGRWMPTGRFKCLGCPASIYTQL